MDTPIVEKSKPKIDSLIECIVQPTVKHVYQLVTKVIQIDLDVWLRGWNLISREGNVNPNFHFL